VCIALILSYGIVGNELFALFGNALFGHHSARRKVLATLNQQLLATVQVLHPSSIYVIMCVCVCVCLCVCVNAYASVCLCECLCLCVCV
jgi:hypothetical protein